MELVDEATFDRIFAVNVKPLYWTAVHAVPAMRRTGGAVVNIASASAERPRPGLAWYGGSKGAVLTLTRTMAIELAGQGIRVNAVTPVAGDTPMLDQFLGGDGDRGTADPALRERFISSIPLGRLCRPADVAEATLFLASGEASFVTGISLPVDGGRCI
jgi:3-oxoacyl-[acyl-carrier protein] reductase